MRRVLLFYLCAMFLGVVFFSCGNESQISDGDSDLTDLENEQVDGDYENNPDAKIKISNFNIVENPANGLSFFADWTTDIPAKTELLVSCSSGYYKKFSNEQMNTKHSVFVMGLIEESDCSFDAIAKDDSGLTRVISKDILVASVPEAFPEIELVHFSKRKMQNGWTLVNLVQSWEKLPLSIAIIDEQGRYRWYYKLPTQHTGSDNELKVMDDGILIGGTSGKIPSQYVSWEGQILWSADFYLHHEILPWAEDQYMFLGVVATCEGAEWDAADVHLSGSMHIWDVKENTTVWNWAFCDHYTPEVIVDDWCHLNAIEKFPEEDAVLISSRDQNAIFKINVESGEVVWKLGENGDFAMNSDDLFYHQHAPEIQENGNVLLFDNGYKAPVKNRPYSRAIEIEYDETSMEAKVVWSYDHNGTFAKVWGDADRMENGNVLITFGQDYGVTRLVEVTHENKPEVVWEVAFDNGWGVYRSDRIVNPTKGYVIENQ